MRAVVTSGVPDAGVIFVADRPEPNSPRRGQVLVRVRAVSPNYRDLLVGRGVGRWASPPGRILGSDAAGEVVEVGEGVTWASTNLLQAKLDPIGAAVILNAPVVDGPAPIEFRQTGLRP